MQLLEIPLLKCQQCEKKQPNLFLKGMSHQILNFSCWTFSTGDKSLSLSEKLFSMFLVNLICSSHSTLRNVVSISGCLSHSPSYVFKLLPKACITCFFDFQMQQTTQIRTVLLEHKGWWSEEKNYSWLFTLPSPSKQRGSSWWSFLSSFFNT